MIGESISVDLYVDTSTAAMTTHSNEKNYPPVNKCISLELIDLVLEF